MGRRREKTKQRLVKKQKEAKARLSHAEQQAQAQAKKMAGQTV